MSDTPDVSRAVPAELREECVDAVLEVNAMACACCQCSAERVSAVLDVLARAGWLHDPRDVIRSVMDEDEAQANHGGGAHA